MHGKCISARLEIIPNVLAIAKEYLRQHPQSTTDEAMDVGYMAYREEMQRETLRMKDNLERNGTL